MPHRLSTARSGRRPSKNQPLKEPRKAAASASAATDSQVAKKRLNGPHSVAAGCLNDGSHLVLAGFERIWFWILLWGCAHSDLQTLGLPPARRCGREVQPQL